MESTLEDRQHNDSRTKEQVAKEAALEALTQKAMRGEREAILSLCSEIAESVLFRVGCLVRNRNDAEDIAQEVLIRVCANIRKMKKPKAFGAWLSCIITNETNRYLAKSVNRPITEDIKEHVNAVTEERADCLPHEYVLEDETRRTVMEKIKKLPEQQRKVVLFYYYDGLTVTEIAKAMGIKKSTVSHYLTAAHDKIKQELERSDKQIELFSGGALAIGPLVAQVLRQQAAQGSIADKAWARQALDNCMPYIQAHKAGASALWTFIGGAAAVAVMGATLLGLWPGGVFQKEPHTIDLKGEIVFQSTNPDGPHANPDHATVWLSDGDELMTARSWCISNENGETVYNGEGGDVGETLQMMRKRGENGVYVLSYLMEGADGATYKVSRWFVIEAG